ncbi:cutinase family protein [Streptacidiphilus sp. EB129]|uniref:cutinase family protein n=1 Tax=Streptacidiphilus sp. EB129 TaxID=3156262 RepID=UPI003513529F
MSCDQPWVILSAYGTGEYTRDDSTGAIYPHGDVGVNDTYIRALENTLVTQGVYADDLTVRNLPYPASAADYPSGWPGRFGPVDYLTSMSDGWHELVKEIQFYSACPSRPTLILVGYSQGAQVIKNAIAQSAIAGNQRDSDEIGAIVNVGDASRYNGQIGLAQRGYMTTLRPDYSVGTADIDHGGLMQRLPVPEVFTGFVGDGRYFDVCRTDDAVCNESAYPGSASWQQRWLTDFLNSSLTGIDAPHVSYRDDGWPQSNNVRAAAVAADTAERAVTAAMRQRDLVHPQPTPPPPSGTAEQMWATDVHVRTSPTTQAAITATLPSPTTVYVSCQEHADPVTAGGVTNDVWSYLPAQHGWISNVFLKGPAWLQGVDQCSGPNPGPPSGLYKCSIGGNPNDWCAHVTAIAPGSYLALQNAPDYDHGHSAYYQGHNGNQLITYCWTTGADDADGTGDHYWFSVDDGANFSGYVNDRYLTTGTYAQWSKIIEHC